MSDASIRIPDTLRGYTVIPNGLLPTGEDRSISARSWGIYVYLLSRPPGWECRVRHLQNVFTEGRDALYTALRELVDTGLMVKETYLDKGMPRQRYALSDSPDADSQDPGRPDAGSPVPGNPPQVTTEVHPLQIEASPGADAPPPAPAAAARRRGTPKLQLVPDDDPHWLRFWALWPRGDSKADARRAWTKAIRKVEPAAIIRGAERVVAQLEADVAEESRRRTGRDPRKFVPYAATWLNAERWADDVNELPLPGVTARQTARAMSPDEWEKESRRA